MLQCADKPRLASSSERKIDPEFLWSVYLRVAGTGVLDVAAAVEKRAQLLRGPEKMFYGLVEFELCDPDGYRILRRWRSLAGCKRQIAPRVKHAP
jgi:hypothetical protein